MCKGKKHEILSPQFYCILFYGFCNQGSVSSLMMATYVLLKHVAVFTCKIHLCVDCGPVTFLYIGTR